MIYSVHDPVRGGFVYYEGGTDTPLNNDLPTPRWPSNITTKLGVPASMAARPLPQGSREVGRGALPVGMISSGKPGEWKGTAKGLLPSGLGLGEFSGFQKTDLIPLGLALGSIGAGCFAYGASQKGKVSAAEQWVAVSAGLGLFLLYALSVRKEQ